MAKGDENALATFYDLTRRQVYGLSVRILGDRALAEEVTLDVYLQVWRTAASYSAQRGSPLAWLMTLTRSRAIDRRRQFKPEVQLDEHHHSQAENAPQMTASGEETAVEAERACRVREALAELTPEQRQVLELAYFRGLSHSEIAECTGLPLGTVKTRIRGGIARLHTLLAPCFREEIS
jgi:RNA polymerase sigma-70 factor (ECF subfamily)